jgi:hypothetical protein
MCCGRLSQLLNAGASQQKDNGYEYGRPYSEDMEFPSVGRIGGA